jgi:cysteine desulfurase
MKNFIYLDHNATSIAEPEVLAKMAEINHLPLLTSSSHQLGRFANKLVEEARAQLKKSLNAENYEVIFTSSSTEATNMTIFGCEAQTVLFSAIEHSSVFNCRPINKKVIEIKALKNGLIDVEDLEKKLPSNGDFLLSLMLANNETGAIQPVEEVSKLIHQKGGLIHCDIVQAVSKIVVDLEKLNIDFASISAHKIGGAQGVGALLIRKGLDIKPLIFGGGQEKSKRSGTLNVAGIIGFGEACKLIDKKIYAYEKVRILRDEMEEKILKISADEVKIFSTSVSRIPNTSYISIKNSDAQTQLINFDLNGICVSAGAACSSGKVSESRVLKAMEIAPEFLNGGIRVSLGINSAISEIEKFIAVWHQFYQRSKK